MPSCFTCGEEITFNKSILSKTGKQIPLWPDQQSTHGHDDDGNAVRGPLPASSARTSTYQTGPTAGFPKPKPQYVQETRAAAAASTAPTDRPSMEAVLLTQVNQAIATLTKKVIEIEERVIKVGEKIDYNTQVDTDKLIGQMQTINDTIAPFLSTQLKVGTELYEEQQKREQKERDEKYRKEQEQIAKWDQAKDVRSEDRELEEAGI